MFPHRNLQSAPHYKGGGGGPTHSAELDLIFHFFSSASHIYQSAVQRRRTKEKRLFIRRLTSAGAAGRSARDVGEHRGGLARKHVVVAICFFRLSLK